MATNIIFIAPVIILFMIKLYSFTKHIKAGTEKLCKKSVFLNFADYFVAFAFEIICIIFGFSGERAGSLDFELKTAIKDVFFDWQTIITLMDIKIAIVSMIITVSAIIMMVFDYRNKRDVRKNIRLFGLLFGSFVICIVYMTVLFIRVGQHKLSRIDNISVVFLFYVMLIGLSCAYLVNKIRVLVALIPLISYILLFSIINVSRIQGNSFDGGGHLYSGAYSGYYNADECYEANCKLISEIVKADKDGLKSVTIDGPWILSQNEWMGRRVSKTLYRHGLISNDIDVVITFTE